jgi:hypothetical protein
MAWSIEDAIANYETSKSEIEDAAANFDTKIGDGDIRSLKYLIDVFRYCVNVATVKQVLCIVSLFFLFWHVKPCLQLKFKGALAAKAQVSQFSDYHNLHHMNPHLQHFPTPDYFLRFSFVFSGSSWASLCHSYLLLPMPPTSPAISPLLFLRGLLRLLLPSLLLLLLEYRSSLL